MKSQSADRRALIATAARLARYNQPLKTSPERRQGFLHMDAPATAPREGRQHFGVFELDARSLELRKNGRLVAVRPQALKLLALLVACPGEVISRVDIQRALW